MFFWHFKLNKSLKQLYVDVLSPTGEEQTPTPEPTLMKGHEQHVIAPML